MAEDSENTYIISFMEYFKDDSDFKDKFRDNGYLCNVHLHKFLRLEVDVDSIKQVLEKQITILNKLSKNLSEIKRKSDYRFSNELMTGEEKVAWIKAVRLWVGGPGIQK